MKAIRDFRNDLLKRKEVQIIITSNGNPGMQNSLKMIAEQFKAKDDVIAVKAVKGKFGRDTFLIDAFIYDSSDQKNMIEPKKKVKKAEVGAAQ